MCCPRLTRGVSLLAPLILVLALPSCSNKTNATTATSGQAAPFGVEVTQLYVTVANHTGSALVGGNVEIIPAGIMPTFKVSWPRIEVGEKREFILNDFMGGDGTPFRRGIIRGRRVKVSAKDLSGKSYEYEAPFE